MKWPESMATVRSRRQQRIQRARQRARIDVARRRRVVERRDLPAPARESALQRRDCASPEPVVTIGAPARPGSAPRGLRRVADHRQVDAVVRADRIRIVVDLDDGRRRDRAAGRGASSTCSARRPRRARRRPRQSARPRSARRSRPRCRAPRGCRRTARWRPPRSRAVRPAGRPVAPAARARRRPGAAPGDDQRPLRPAQRFGRRR